MFTAFQFGFDHGYQVIYPASLAPNGNKKTKLEYVPRSYELQELRRLNTVEQVKVKQELATQDLKAKELQIEELELQRLREGLADQQLQAELLRLMLERRDMLMIKLELERILKQLLLDDDALLILLLSSPF